MPISQLFSFEDLSSKDKTVKAVQQQFIKLGAQVAQVDIGAVKRYMGTTFRELSLTFADSQVVTFRIKRTGDIFEVKINKKTTPIKAQDDQAKAIKEIADLLDRGRSAFQKKLARAKTKLPPGIKSTVKKKSDALKEKKTALEDAVAAIKKQIEQERERNGRLKTELAGLQSRIRGLQSGATAN